MKSSSFQKDSEEELDLKDPEEKLVLKDPEEELVLKDPEEELLLTDPALLEVPVSSIRCLRMVAGFLLGQEVSSKGPCGVQVASKVLRWALYNEKKKYLMSSPKHQLAGLHSPPNPPPIQVKISSKMVASVGLRLVSVAPPES